MCERGMCKSCAHLRRALRTAASRQQKFSESRSQRTSVDSHTPYCHLTSEEKDLRLRNIHHSLAVSRQKNRLLESKLNALIEEQGLNLEASDASDVASLVSEVSPLVKANFAPNSPQKIFWDQQLLYNTVKDKRQMRWHPLIVRFALNLKYLSTSAYRAMRKSGIIHLPSERTLSDYTHWTAPHSGVSLEFIEEFTRMLDDVPCGQHQCSLSMDEMKIKSGLVVDKYCGRLIGFVDLGQANRDIEKLMSGEDAAQKQIADQVFVFMARAVFKPSLSIPVAHYFCKHIKGLR